MEKLKFFNEQLGGLLYELNYVLTIYYVEFLTSGISEYDII